MGNFWVSKGMAEGIYEAAAKSVSKKYCEIIVEDAAYEIFEKKDN